MRSVASVLVAPIVVTLGATLCLFCASSDGQTTAADSSIRSFKIQVSQTALDDLRRRIAATRWPDRETVTDQSQGVQLVQLQALVKY